MPREDPADVAAALSLFGAAEQTVTGPAPERIIYGPDPLAEVARLRAALTQIRQMAVGRATAGGPGNVWDAVAALTEAALQTEGTNA